MASFISALALQNSIKNSGLETDGTMLIMKGSTLEDVQIITGSLTFSPIIAGTTTLNITGGSITINEGIMTILSGTIQIFYLTLHPNFPCSVNVLSGTLSVSNTTTMGILVSFVSGSLVINSDNAVINNGVLNGNTTTDSTVIFSGTTKTHSLNVLDNLTVAGNICCSWHYK